jgi:hypothetical protein
MTTIVTPLGRPAVAPSAGSGDRAEHGRRRRGQETELSMGEVSNWRRNAGTIDGEMRKVRAFDVDPAPLDDSRENSKARGWRGPPRV